MKYEVEIPIPPSTNSLYTNVAGKGRKKTSKYKYWLKDTLWTLKAEVPVLIPPVKLGVTIYGGKGFRMDSDISNRMKAVEDALVSTGRLEDDNVKFVTECRQRYVEGEGEAKCILSIIDMREE